MCQHVSDRCAEYADKKQTQMEYRSKCDVSESQPQFRADRQRLSYLVMLSLLSSFANLETNHVEDNRHSLAGL